MSDVISGTVDLDVGVDVYANLGDSRLKPSEASFSNVDNFRAEGCSDVIPSVFVDPTGVKVPVKFGDSRTNHSRDIRLPRFVTNDD